MSSIRVPFLSSPAVRSGSRVFIGVGSILLQVLPRMKYSVEQSGVRDEYKVEAREYLAFCFFIAAIAFIFVGGGVTMILVSKNAKMPMLGPTIGAVVGFAFFLYLLVYPQSIVNRRVKYLERNLLFAMRSLLIQIRSGVPIFNAMASVAMGNYGSISEEFKLVVDKVNAGRPTVEVLEELAVRNPSIYFRRALWQLVNSMKSGSDVGKNLEELIRSLSKEQLVEIGKYKSILNPLAMMYMMVAVIAPSLGTTMLIILSYFPGMGNLANELVFWGLLAGVVFMQFVFLGLIKSKRPNLIGG